MCVCVCVCARAHVCVIVCVCVCVCVRVLQVAIKKMDVSRALSLIACTAEVMTLDQLQGCPYVLPLHGVLLSSHVVGGRKTRTAGLVMDKGVCTVSDRLR